MVAPSITFRDNSEAAIAAVYNYGTIDTGSSGSTITWQLWNNWSGSGTNAVTAVASAVLSGSGDTLGLGAHDSGSADHLTQSTLPTGSLWVSGSSYIISSGIAGTGLRTTGSLTSAWEYIWCGSSGNRKILNVGDGKLSGSADLGGTSGSAWVVSHYCFVPSGQAQGTVTGSYCMKYTYT